MALSQRKTTIAILRGILGPIHGKEINFAALADRSPSWVKKVSSGNIELAESTANILQFRTGIGAHWLMGEVKGPPVTIYGKPFTRETFDAIISSSQKDSGSARSRVEKALKEIRKLTAEIEGLLKQI